LSVFEENLATEGTEEEKCVIKRVGGVVATRISTLEKH
jgi:hypothetical protein